MGKIFVQKEAYLEMLLVVSCSGTRCVVPGVAMESSSPSDAGNGCIKWFKNGKSFKD